MAYELLFRSSQHNGAIIDDDVGATSSVIHYAFSELGIQHVLGNYQGFINLSKDLLLSDLIELLPKTQVVLELLETITIDEQIIQRCADLKAKGFTLALDDVIGMDAQIESILPYIDIVKLDVLAMSVPDLQKTVRALMRWPVKLLAEKIDNEEQHALCMKLGFDLFQGYYFAKPTMLEGKRTDTSKIALLSLLGLVIRDADIAEIEQIFKRNPNLAVNLMKLVNSVGSGVGRQIDSLNQALVVLGRQHLKRWLQILMFAVKDTGDMKEDNPLMLLAIVRGKQMELLSAKLGFTLEEQDKAFMVGIFSLLDALFNQPLHDVITPLNLGETMNAALLERKGKLGQLLQLMENTEQKTEVIDFSAWPQLTADDLLTAELSALDWANQLSKAI